MYLFVVVFLVMNDFQANMLNSISLQGETTFDTSRHQLVCRGQVLQGITKVLHRTFFPYYNYDTANVVPGASALPRPLYNFELPASVGTHAVRRRQRNNRRSAGLSLGKKIDKEIALTVQWFRKHSLPRQYFFSKAIRRSYQGPNALIKRKCGRLSLHTRQFWIIAEQLEITPIYTQVPVGNHALRLGTCVDVVALDKNGRDLILEIKQGFESYLWKSTRQRMRYPFQNQTDCCANQFQLQLLLTTMLYKHSHPDRIVDGSWIIHFHTHGAQIHELRPWAAQNAAKMLEMLRCR